MVRKALAFVIVGVLLVQPAAAQSKKVTSPKKTQATKATQQTREIRIESALPIPRLGVLDLVPRIRVIKKQNKVNALLSPKRAAGSYSAPAKVGSSPQQPRVLRRAPIVDRPAPWPARAPYGVEVDFNIASCPSCPTQPNASCPQCPAAPQTATWSPAPVGPSFTQPPTSHTEWRPIHNHHVHETYQPRLATLQYRPTAYTATRAKSSREQAIAHLRAAAAVLKAGKGNTSAVQAIERVIAQQKQAIVHARIEQKQRQIAKLQREISQLTASIRPKQVMVQLVIARVDTSKLPEGMSVSMSKCCAAGQCQSHVTTDVNPKQFEQMVRHLQKSGKGAFKVMARPQVMTTNNRPATVEMAMAAPNGQAFIGSCKILPEIKSGQQIALGLDLNCRHPLARGTVLPAPVRSKSHSARFRCLVRSGKGAVLTQVLPGNTSKKGSKHVLVVMLAPTIIQPNRLPVARGYVPVPANSGYRSRAVYRVAPAAREAKKSKKKVSDVINGFFFSVPR